MVKRYWLKMTTIVRFEEIEAWQTARELTSHSYDPMLPGEFARNFGLCDPLQTLMYQTVQSVEKG
jgi:hypothetical protein